MIYDSAEDEESDAEVTSPASCDLPSRALLDED
jgi:hypothetical protein